MYPETFHFAKKKKQTTQKSDLKLHVLRKKVNSRHFTIRWLGWPLGSGKQSSKYTYQLDETALTIKIFLANVFPHDSILKSLETETSVNVKFRSGRKIGSASVFPISDCSIWHITEISGIFVWMISTQRLLFVGSSGTLVDTLCLCFSCKIIDLPTRTTRTTRATRTSRLAWLTRTAGITRANRTAGTSRRHGFVSFGLLFTT